MEHDCYLWLWLQERTYHAGLWIGDNEENPNEAVYLYFQSKRKLLEDALAKPVIWGLWQTQQYVTVRPRFRAGLLEGPEGRRQLVGEMVDVLKKVRNVFAEHMAGAPFSR